MNQLHTSNLVFNQKIKGHLPITRLSLSNSGEVTVAVSDEHQPRLYHLMRITAAGEWSEIGTFAVETLSSIDFSENSKVFVAITDDDVYVFRDDRKTRFFPDRRDNYTCVSISSSGEYIVVGSADMILSGYSVTLARTSGGQVWTKDLPFSVTSVQISGDASRILAGSDDGSAVMLDSARGTVWQIDGDDPIAAVAVSNSFETTVLTTRGGATQVVGPMGNRLWEIVGDGSVSCCAVSGNGQLIAVARTTSSASGQIEFYDTNGTPLVEHGCPTEVLSLACSENGRYAAASCEDGTLRVLEITLAPIRARAAEEVRSLFEEGCAAADKADYASALQKLTRLLELSPCHLDACRKLNEVKDAFVQKRMALAAKLSAGKQPGRAMQELQAAAQVCPYDPQVFERLAQSRQQFVADILDAASGLEAAGQFEDGLEKVEEAIQLDFANLQAREQLSKLEDALARKYAADADAALDAGQPARAVQILEKASALQPTSEFQEKLAVARANMALADGRVLYESKKYSQALFQFRRVLSIDPENAEAEKYIEYCESLCQDDSLFDRFSKLE